jgi:chemosensory pili system protein ChpA (sensor histidine kinase/response regulator)
MIRPSCVLLVEDDLEVSEAITTTFRSEGHRVMTARDGSEALDQLREGDLPTVVVLDLMMPVMDGIQFLQAARADERLRSLPVVVITSGEQELPFGAQAIVRKPADMDVLLAMVGERCAHTASRGRAYPAT